MTDQNTKGETLALNYKNTISVTPVDAATVNVALNLLLDHFKQYGAKDTTKFVVVGGVWEKDWSGIIENPEFHGFFDNYKDAYDKWKERSWWSVDNCQSRFLVISV